MNSKKYQVFISSTYSDLKEEREGIIKAILELYHIPIGMEMFSAEDEDQWEIIRRTIDVSDYYILILGLRYGSKTSDGTSFTRKEYEYALQIKIPILAFIMDEAVSLSKARRDDDLTEVQCFREAVLKNSKMAQFWRTKDELIKNVSISLTKQIAQKPGVGWVRGDKLVNEEALSKELTTLSSENRQLRERVVELESTIVTRSPNIIVDIDLPKGDKNFNSYKRIEIPEAIDPGAIEDHLKPYISEEQIEAYNEAINCQDQIDAHNIEAERFYKIKNYAIPLVIKVANKGSMKANNIFIDIAFPDEFFVCDDSEEFKEPTNPLPRNPILIAQQKYEADQRVKLSKPNSSERFGILDYLSQNKGIFGTRPLPHHVPKFNPPNPNWGSRLNGNHLKIKINDLLHTRQIELGDEYKITPLKSGEFIIKISVICEEYAESRDQIIEVNV